MEGRMECWFDFERHLDAEIIVKKKLSTTPTTTVLSSTLFYMSKKNGAHLSPCLDPRKTHFLVPIYWNQYTLFQILLTYRREVRAIEGSALV
jgi:hypothetical protein